MFSKTHPHSIVLKDEKINFENKNETNNHENENDNENSERRKI